MNWNDKSMQQYMKEIGETDLITPVQERELAARIKNGDEAAREQMIKANLRLVVKIANDYSNYGLPLSDLISEGNIGLMKAVERFDPDKGGKLSTYGSWWIKQGIKRALANQTKTIRLPSHLVEKIGRMRRMAHKLTDDLGRDPTHKELAKAMDVEEKTITHWKTVSLRPTSLNAPIGENDGADFSDIIGDDKAVHPDKALDEQQLQDGLKTILQKLDTREQDIIMRRYGLKGKTSQTLEDVGKVHHITRERVRQIQNSAISKLKEYMSEAEFA